MTNDEFIRRYLTELYDNRHIDRIAEFVGDPQIRHVGGETTTLSLAENTERITAVFEKYTEVDLWPVLLVVSNDIVTCAWNANLSTQGGPRAELSGVEVFRIADNRIAETWNTKEADGHWKP